jgi:hypothetical protein
LKYPTIRLADIKNAWKLCVQTLITIQLLCNPHVSAIGNVAINVGDTEQSINQDDRLLRSIALRGGGDFDELLIEEGEPTLALFILIQIE